MKINMRNIEKSFITAITEEYNSGVAYTAYKAAAKRNACRNLYEYGNLAPEQYHKLQSMISDMRDRDVRCK